MSSISAIGSALYDILKNLRQFDGAASRVAGQPPDSDLAADIIDLKTARHGIYANAQVIHTADKMLGTLIDTFA